MILYCQTLMNEGKTSRRMHLKRLSTNFKVAVVIPLYNSEQFIERLILSVLGQTRVPDEIILIDDGSSDRTREIAESFLSKHRCLSYSYQSNRGAAAARNQGWRRAMSEVIVFTDHDCLPEKDWLEEILKPFSDTQVGAVGGVYRTLKPHITLAKFIGLELDYKYQKVVREIDCHPTSSLAVRKDILEEIGGFYEGFDRPSAEDWDLTYKISSICRLVIQKTSVTGHFHPESLIQYLKIQYHRAYNRVFLYQVHPGKKKGDSYTDSLIPLRIFSSLAFLCFFPLYLLSPRVKSWAIFQLLFFLGGLDFGLFLFLLKRSVLIGFYGVFVQSLRNYVWLIGILFGYAGMACKKISKWKKLPAE